MVVPATRQRFVFVFPSWVGHVNPSLPLARRLVALGHEVHYVCFEQVRLKIEGTGAVFHSAVACEPELYEGRGEDYVSMFKHLKAEFGVHPERIVLAIWQLRNVMLQLQLPGLLRLLRHLGPSAVVSCPLSSPEGACAATVLGIPSVALNTFAGPGALKGAIATCLQTEGITHANADRLLHDWAPNRAAVNHLRCTYGLQMELGMAQLGFLHGIAKSAVTLTTTSADLEDPMDPELERAYQAAGASFVAVGPLLEPAGAWRPLGAGEGVASSAGTVLEQVRVARAADRPVVLVSMGTVVTGDMPYWGWHGRPTDAEGRPRGLSGRELCQAAWAGAFDAFGTEAAEDGALLVVSLGPQSDALTDMVPPPNVAMAPFLPQVEILRAGVAVFLTHGGQNSFMESLVHGTPVVVCPGFSDQIVNSRKAEALGVGLKVDRPDPDFGAAAAAAAQYRSDVKEAVLEVASRPEFRGAARRCAEVLAASGGVARAVDLILGAAVGGKARELAPVLQRSLGGS